MNKSINPDQEKKGENLDKGFTVKEVASFIDETPNVIRNWFKELRIYIPHEKNSNGYNVYKQEGIERFKEIKSLHREQNWSVKQIEHYFATNGESFKPDPEKSTGDILADELRSLKCEMKALREDNQVIKDELEKQKGFNKALIEELQKLDRNSTERHNKITERLKNALEAKKQIAAAAEKEETKKGFFAKLFGK